MGEATRGIYPLAHEAYRPRPNIERWAEAILPTFHRMFPRSAGAAARVLDLKTRTVRGGYMAHALRRDLEPLVRQQERISANRVDLVSLGRGLRRLCGEPMAEELRDDPYVVQFRRNFRDAGLDDMRHLTATDGVEVCVTLGVFVPVGVRVPGSPAAWRRAESYFGAGLRMQFSIAQLRKALRIEPNGALLSLDGEVLEASGASATAASRARLREVARRRPRLCTKEAEEVWRGVVQGTWSVVERHFDDGKRYVLAIPITAPPDPRALLPKERQVAALAVRGASDKRIALELGMTRSTAATHVTSVLRKLGVSSRLELVGTFVVDEGGEA